MSASTTPCHVDLLVDELDPMESPADAKELAELLPDVSVYLLPGAGHAAPIQATDEVASLIRLRPQEAAPPGTVQT